MVVTNPSCLLHVHCVFIRLCACFYTVIIRTNGMVACMY